MDQGSFIGGERMKVGDLIRAKQMYWMEASGYLLHILSISGEFVGVVILSGPRLGQSHTVHVRKDARDFEVINESR